MLTANELHEVKMRLRYVADVLVAVRDGIPEDEEVQLAMSIRKVENDLVNLAGSIKAEAS